MMRYDFLALTPYKGYGTFDGLLTFEIPSDAQKTLDVIPIGLSEEAISTPDKEFNEGLEAIGAKYGFSLKLPFWAYEK